MFAVIHMDDCCHVFGGNRVAHTSLISLQFGQQVEVMSMSIPNTVV